MGLGPAGPQPAGVGVGVRWSAGKGGDLSVLTYGIKVALGTWNIKCLEGKGPELVWEMEQYQLDITGLTSTHDTRSGTKILKSSWTLGLSRVAEYERVASI